MSNKTGLHVLKRAQSMKKENDGSIPVNKSSCDGTGQTEPLISSDRETLTKFSDKYGLPFSMSHSMNNGDVETRESNGSSKNKMFEKNNNSESNQLYQNSSKGKVARDRFRSAGMKARFARRMEKILEDRMTVKQIFNRYVQNSTLHGFRFIFMKTYIIRRVLWSLLTFTMALIFFTELKNSVELFFEYPFTTTSTLEYVPRLTFPAISLCNLNNFQVSKIQANKLKRLYKQGQLPFERNWEDPGYDIEGEELANLLKTSSQTINDLFRSCEWKSRDTAKTGVPNLCGTYNFSTFSNLYGQTCYTFNPGHSNLPLLSLNETGLNMAFKLEVDLSAFESLNGLQEVGLKIVVHDQNDSALQQAGFVVSPGFQTFVEMKVRKTENLHPPYATKCGERQLKYSSNYRQSKCFLEQLSDQIKRKCKCRGPYMPDTSLRYCSLNETVTCLMPIVYKFDRKTSDACPVDCESLQYITSLSYARFLSKVGKNPHQYDDASYISQLSQIMNETQMEQYIQENIVVLQFFYQEMKEENVRQEPSYDFYKLVGDVGGQLGLMLGASVLTLVEFVDLFLFTCYHQLLRLSRKKKRGQENGAVHKS